MQRVGDKSTLPLGLTLDAVPLNPTMRKIRACSAEYSVSDFLKSQKKLLG